jgi:hypothetical protein
MWMFLLILLIGIVFGYVRKGKQDLWGLLRTGALVGVVLGAILGVIAFFLAPGGIGLALGFLGAVGIFIAFILLVILFIVGVFIGDYIEKAMEKKPA